MDEKSNTILTEIMRQLSERVGAIEQRLQSSTSTVTLDKEHDRILVEMTIIRNTYGDHQTWSATDKKRFQQLRKRRNELRKILGIQY